MITLGAALYGLEQVGIVLGGGQNHNLDRGVLGADQSRRIQSAQLGHVQVHQDNFGMQPRRLLDRLTSVLRLPHDVNAVCLEQAAQTVAKQWVIVGYQDPHGCSQ